MRTTLRMVSLGFALALTACGGAQYAERTDDVVEVPESYDDAPVSQIGVQGWCTDFGDSSLDAVVQRAWSDNLELKAAWARIEQARAVADRADAEVWPTLGANARGEYSQGGVDRGGPGADGGSGGEAFWQLSAAAAYEVDIWGRNRKRAAAADLEAAAVEATGRALAITLTSEVAEAWFDVIAQRERLQLLERQLEISVDVLELTELRQRRGLATALDVAQQRQNVQSLRGQVATARTLLGTSQNRLAVLIGEPPSTSDLVTGQVLPDVSPLPGVGVPADLLERRPDVRAAYLRLQAADERTAAAVADRLPRLRLSADLGFQAEQIANLFEQLFWSVAGSLSQPIFEGGRFAAEVRRSEAAAEEQLYTYGNTLLVAMREVRDALVREENQVDRIETLVAERAAAEAAHDIAQRRYQKGILEYFRVLDALQALQQVERDLLEARRQQISNRIGLCRALGGSWAEEVEPNLVDD